MFEGRQQVRLDLTRHPMNGKPASLASALVLCLLSAAPLEAATIPVNTTLDGFFNDGLCGLREAIEAANRDEALWGCPAGQGADRIELGPGDFVLGLEGSREDDNQTGDLDLQGELEVVGAGMDLTWIDGAGLDRVFDLHGSGPWRISDLTIARGAAPDATLALPRGEEGGGVRLGAGALTLGRCRITDNKAGRGPALRDEGTYHWNLTQGGNGGGLFAGAGSSVRLEGCEVQRNRAGGTVFMDLTSGTSSSGDGHGIFAQGVGLWIFGSTIADNGPEWGWSSFGSEGGGIYSACPLVMEDSIVERNASGSLNSVGQYYGPWYMLGGDGGGIYATDRVSIRRSSFVDNPPGRRPGEWSFHGRRGGALFTQAETLIEDSALIRNSAGGFDLREGYRGGSGGAIHAQGPLTLRRVALIRNLAGPGPEGFLERQEANGPGGDGGGVYAAGSLLVEGSFVIENRAGTGGGAYYTTGDAFELYGRPGGDGGGILARGDATISQTLFMDNEAGVGTGGDLYNNSETPFWGHGGHGGGLAVGGQARVERSTFIRNRGGLGESGGVWIDQNYHGGVGGPGGAIFVGQGSQLTLIGSTLSGNVTGESDAHVESEWVIPIPADGQGGGIYNLGHSTLIDSTVAFNRTGVDARQPGGGLAGMGTWDLLNTLVARNEATPYPDGVIDPEGLVLSGPDFIGDADLFGTLRPDEEVLRQENPGLLPLASTGGVLLNHGLAPQSPALDTGPSTCTPADQRGVLRPQGEACDIGAIEVVAQGIVARWDRWVGTQQEPLTVEAPGVLRNDSAPGGEALEVVQGPFNGALALGQDGGFVYTPREGFHGLDLFVYRLGDPIDGHSMEALVKLEILLPDYTIANAVEPLNLMAFDSDGGGMGDQCEEAHGFDPHDRDDDQGDRDGDGLDNVDECREGTDPISGGTITGLEAVWPPHEARLPADEALFLIVQNAVDSEGLPLTYRFDLHDAQPRPGAGDATSGPWPEDPGEQTRWAISIPLLEDHLYQWSVTATSPNVARTTPLRTVLIDTLNEAAPSPVPRYPSGPVRSLLPRLLARTEEDGDPEGDLTWVVFDLQEGETLVASGRVPWVGDMDVRWSPPNPLEPNRTYRWRVSTLDELGAHNRSSWLEFTTPDPPEADPEPDPQPEPVSEPEASPEPEQDPGAEPEVFPSPEPGLPLQAPSALSPSSGARLEHGQPLRVVVGHVEGEAGAGLTYGAELVWLRPSGAARVWEVNGMEPADRSQTEVEVPPLPATMVGDFVWRASARRPQHTLAVAWSESIPFSIEVASDPASGGCQSLPGRPGSAPGVPILWGLMALLTLGARLAGARRRAASPASR